MKPISFMTANFVARELSYRMTKGWGEGAAATAEYFRPGATFAERFDAMLDEISSLGFSAIDLWTAHLDPDRATAAQIGQAAAALANRGLTVTSLAHYIGDLSQVGRLEAIASALGTKIIGGGCHGDLLGGRRSELIDALEKHDLILGFENHPEKSAGEVLDKIGDAAGGRIGVAVDTGWFGTQRHSAADAIRQLAGRIVHVHLKDVHEPEVRSTEHDIRQGQVVTLKDMGHETCALGDGCVGIEDCVKALKEIGYTGGLSIEHEPEDRSPVPDIELSLRRLKTWLAQ